MKTNRDCSTSCDRIKICLLSTIIGSMLFLNVEQPSFILAKDYKTLLYNENDFQSSQWSKYTGPGLLRRRMSIEATSGASEFTWPPTPDPFAREAGVLTHNLHPSNSGSYMNSDGVIAPSDVVPAVMVAVASSIILCALILYLSDLRDRWYHERLIQEQRHRREVASSKQMDTLASSGGYWVSSSCDRDGRLCSPAFPQHVGGYPVLQPPPSEYQPEFVEDISISPVSTMTASLALESSVVQRSDSDNVLENSMEITELSEFNRVAQDIDLKSLVSLSRIPMMAQLISKDGDHAVSSNQRSETFPKGVCGDILNGPMNSPNVHGEACDSHDMAGEDESGWTSSAGQSEYSSEISIGTYLRSVHSVKSRSSSAESPCSSSTSVSREESQTDLVGEQCLEAKGRKSTSSSVDGNSLERSPDTPLESAEGSTRSCNDLAQLEMLYGNREEVQSANSIGDIIDGTLEEMLESENPALYDKNGEKLGEQGKIEGDAVDKEYIRSIIYIPACSNGHDTRFTGLGIEVEEASCGSGHPSVKSIHQDSPLRGRIFRGDVILAVNNEKTIGLGAQETAERLDNDASKRSLGQETNPTMSVVKLTVMSTESDGSVTESEGSDVFVDAGVQETASEV